jgi:hypothetical protein
MAVQSTVLFDSPQAEIASLIVDRISQSCATSIVSGFVTPSGVDAISAPIIASPAKLNNLIVGAATYPGFEALDALIASGVPATALHVHLGHTRKSGGRKNPFARYRPMLHSKVYYMEMPDDNACAFIGSHNITSFALLGQNGEAAILLEGPVNSIEFLRVRKHIASARAESIVYQPDMKEALAWWTREFIDGLRAEMDMPSNFASVRTILIFASPENAGHPKIGDQIYFEIPSGIEQIESFRTEAHLFIFDKLPSTAREAINRIPQADLIYNCTIQGVENRQGNLEVTADWRIDLTPSPVLRLVARRAFRPQTPKGMQQVRAEVKSSQIGSFEYFFDRPRAAWDPILSDEIGIPSSFNLQLENRADVPALTYRGPDWRLVTGLVPRSGEKNERDEAALRLAAPESGSFILVSVRRRLKSQVRE